MLSLSLHASKLRPPKRNAPRADNRIVNVLSKQHRRDRWRPWAWSLHGTSNGVSHRARRWRLSTIVRARQLRCQRSRVRAAHGSPRDHIARHARACRVDIEGSGSELPRSDRPRTRPVARGKAPPRRKCRAEGLPACLRCVHATFARERERHLKASRRGEDHCRSLGSAFGRPVTAEDRRPEPGEQRGRIRASRSSRQIPRQWSACLTFETGNRHSDDRARGRG